MSFVKNVAKIRFSSQEWAAGQGQSGILNSFCLTCPAFSSVAGRIMLSVYFVVGLYLHQRNRQEGVFGGIEVRAAGSFHGFFQLAPAAQVVEA